MRKESLASREVLVAAHSKVREKIHSFDMIAEELDALEQASSAEEWVEAKLGETKGALSELERLLRTLHTWMIAHWRLEGKELMPFLRENGQDDFVATLLSGHRKMGIGLSRFHSKAEELGAKEMSAEQLSAEVTTLKDALTNLFEKLEKHADSEEQMLFQIGHGA